MASATTECPATSHPWWAGPDCTSIYGRRGHWFPHAQLMTPYYVRQSPGVPRDRPQWLQACAPTKTISRFLCENSASCHHLQEGAWSSRLNQTSLCGPPGFSVGHTPVIFGHPWSPSGYQLCLPNWRLSEQGTTQNTPRYPNLAQWLVDRPRAGKGDKERVSSDDSGSLATVCATPQPLKLTHLWGVKDPWQAPDGPGQKFSCSHP